MLPKQKGEARLKCVAGDEFVSSSGIVSFRDCLRCRLPPAPPPTPKNYIARPALSVWELPGKRNSGNSCKRRQKSQAIKHEIIFIGKTL